MTIDMDDEELTFDEAAPAEAEPAPAADGPAPTPEAPKAAEPQSVPQVETAPPPEKKRSRTGMAVAAGFALCILASVTSAVQAWRAASIAAASSEGASSRNLAARLNSIEKILEQQRDSIDALSANPNAPIAADKDSEQLNALAAAVRANQEMNERLPSTIMQQVDNRLAQTRQAGRTVPVGTKPATRIAASKAKPAQAGPKTAVAKPVVKAPVIAPQPVVQVEAKRPAGEAIRYP